MMSSQFCYCSIAHNHAHAAATAYSNAHFGPGTGPILLHDVKCIGIEATLGNCSSDPIGVHNCVHSEDAGVGCQGLLPQF